MPMWRQLLLSVKAVAKARRTLCVHHSINVKIEEPYFVLVSSDRLAAAGLGPACVCALQISPPIFAAGYITSPRLGWGLELVVLAPEAPPLDSTCILD